MSGADADALRRLAAHAGIVSEYLDQTGKETRRTSDDTCRALLAAMRIDELASTHAGRTPPVHVIEAGDTLNIDGPFEIETETGERCAARDGAFPYLPLGYHTLRSGNTEQSLIIVPPRCVTPDALLGDAKAFGVIANLYTLRSATNWGVGDFTDLGALAAWCGSVGGDFVGVNPLHALLNRGYDVSPYSPVSRLFRNPIYIDVAQVPELAHAPEVHDRIGSPEFGAGLDALRESRDVRYDQVMAVKGLVLDALHRVFAESGADDERHRDYAAFVARMDPALTRFAIWMTIAERHGSDWRQWPEPLQQADGTAVRELAREYAARVDYHRWLQFEADRQLAGAAQSARDAGMRIGLYQDLAVGSSGAGADAWAFPDLFAHGATVGAPPDPYAAAGQNWGFPPIDPHALRRSGYRYFIELLRQGFRHAGALRIDHVLGFFRLFWIPEGRGAADGAYVRYPTDDLFGIVALESVRHNALVVGEDLGTVPHEVPRALEKWGVLSSKVFLFEHDEAGAFRPSSGYPALALATADTHDMAPIAGFWTGRDIELRCSLGLLDGGEAARATEERARARAALLDRLADDKILPRDVPHTPAELRGAMHAFVCRTPSQLAGLALDDLAGEAEPINVPGVGQSQFRSWTRKMREPLEVIISSDDTATALRCDGRRGVRHA